MLYRYPPIQWTDPDSWVWIGITSASWLMTIGIIVATAIYFRRACQGKPSTDWMFAKWLLAGVVQMGLALLIFVGSAIRGQPLPALFVSIPALACDLMVLVHCGLALATHNVHVRQQAAAVFQCLMAMGGVVLLGLFLLPATRGAREAGRRSQCKNNLKQLGIAQHNFHDTYLQFASPLSRDGDGPLYSWRVALLPFVDQAPLYIRYDKKQTWDSVANIGFSRKELGAYSCPSLPSELRRNASQQAFTAYATVTGSGTAFPNGKAPKISEIKDGTSHTVLIVEACGQQIVWTKPQDIHLSAQNVGVNLPGTQPNQSPGTWSSFHRGGSHTLLADGSVRFIGEKADPNVLKALITASAQDTVGDF